jgi:hypothetical protein
MDQAFIDHIDTLPLTQLKAEYRSERGKGDDADSDKLDAIFSRVACLIAETDSDYDPESGNPEPDFNSAAKDFLGRD